MKKKLFGTKRRATITSILAVAVLTTTAFAAWQVITSSGSGSAKIGTLVAPTIAATASTVGDTVPSAGIPNATGTLSLSVSNPNDSTLYLKSFTIDDNLVTGGNGGCDATQLRTTYLYVGFQDNPIDASAASPITGLTGMSVPPGDTTLNIPSVIGLTDDTPTGCQGVSIDGFTITNATFSTSDS